METFLWKVDPATNFQSNYMAVSTPVYLSPGNFTAYFELKVSNFNWDNWLLATVDVYDATSQISITSKDIHRSEFQTILFYLYPVKFSAVNNHQYQFRVYWYYNSTAPRLTLRGVYLLSTIVYTPVTLPFNLRGIGNAPGDANIDGKGYAFKSEDLNASVFVNYNQFNIGPTTSGVNNVLEGGPSVKVALPNGHYNYLNILGLGVYGPLLNQTFIISYTDGSFINSIISLSDWFCATTQAGESIALAFHSRWSTTGYDYGNIHIYSYSIQIDPTKSLQSFTLPNNNDVKILAITLSYR